jgi:predicted transcriptional regulator
MSNAASEKVKVSYYVSASVARAVRLLAAREERSQSEVAGEALEAYLTERQESLEWLRAAEPGFAFWDNDVDAVYDDL